MADQRMIGDILSERRHSLGLSIDRVVSDTKLQRRMVEAFEDSDFDAMPPKGYAQASLASYARYLSLDPNAILRVYDDQLYDFERETSLAARPSGRERAARPSASTERYSRSARPRSYTEDEPATRGRRGQEYDEAPYGSQRRGRGEDARTPARYDDMRDDTRGRSASRTDRSRERGLYESGHRSEARSSTRTSSRYADERTGRRGSGQDERSRTAEPRRERSERPERQERYERDDAYGARSERPMRAKRERDRGEPQVVTLDDGYQGGSGGSGSDPNRYQPRPSRNAFAQRQSLSEVLRGFWDSIRDDRRTFAIIAAAVTLTVVVVLIVGISSCVRTGTTDEGTDNNIPVTPVGQDAPATEAQQTPLAPSIDLAALPANSVLTFAKSADSAVQTWVEVWVDDIAVYAAIPAAGESGQWTITRNATVKFTNLDGITVLVNDTPVTPTLNNIGEFTLTMTVPEAVDPAAVDDGSAAV